MLPPSTGDSAVTSLPVAASMTFMAAFMRR